jgi:hypothetical protein
VNIDGVHSMAYFGFIEIMYENKPYPTLMGLEWDFYNHTIIKLQRVEMIFEVGDNLKFTSPLDLLE